MIAESAPPLFVLWGIPFVLTGLQLMVGRFFTDSFVRAGSSYVLTDRRALIVKTWPRRQVLSIDFRSIGSLARLWHRDGTMTIVFGVTTGSGRSRVEPPKLAWIRDGEHVHALIWAAMDEDEDEASR